MPRSCLEHPPLASPSPHQHKPISPRCLQNMQSDKGDKITLTPRTDESKAKSWVVSRRHETLTGEKAGAFINHPSRTFHSPLCPRLPSEKQLENDWRLTARQRTVRCLPEQIPMT